MKGVVTLQQSRHCAASSSTAAVAALPALRILCLFAVTLPVCGSQLPRISQAELLSVIRSTLCRRTMMSLPYAMSSDGVLIIVSLRTASLACCIVSVCLGI